MSDLRPSELQEKAQALIHAHGIDTKAQQNYRFCEWVQAVTDILAPPASEEKVTPRTIHINCPLCGAPWVTGHDRAQPVTPPLAMSECPNCKQQTSVSHKHWTPKPNGQNYEVWICSQATAPKVVKMEKVRAILNRLWSASGQEISEDQITAALAELDAHEGRKG